MTRWKREPCTVIRTMYEHNQWSRYQTHLLRAAEEMGLNVGFSRYSHREDGSTVRVWYVSGAQLERVGGQSALERRAAESADRENPQRCEMW